MALLTVIEERPIDFYMGSIAAALAGRKSQVRHVCKPQPTARGQHEALPNHGSVRVRVVNMPGAAYLALEDQLIDGSHRTYHTLQPFGEPGDRLWVREPWNKEGGAYSYLADGNWIADYHKEHPQTKKRVWNPSIQMPRAASRLLLEVASVGIERLQEITEKGAEAEGWERDDEPCDHARRSCADIGCMGQSRRSTFVDEWNKIHEGRASWSRNPYVWVITFQRVRP